MSKARFKSIITSTLLIILSTAAGARADTACGEGYGINLSQSCVCKEDLTLAIYNSATLATCKTRVGQKILTALHSATTERKPSSCALDLIHFTCSYHNDVPHLGKLLRDHRATDSNVFGASACKADLQNSFDQPTELEQFFAGDLNLGVGAPSNLINQCKIPTLRSGKMGVEETKASIAEYYTDLARLNNAVKETLQAISGIDSLKGKDLLGGVDCSAPELKSAEQFCATLKSTCSAQGGNYDVALKSKQNLIEKKTLQNEINWFNQNGTGGTHNVGSGQYGGQVTVKDLSPAEKTEIAKRTARIKELDDDTPAIRDDTVAMNEINDAAKHSPLKNPEDPNNIAQLPNEVFSKAVWDHHSATRDLLVERLNKLKTAASCLGGHGDCTNFDQVMEMDATTDLPYATIDPKADPQTQSGMRAYNAGLCQSQARTKARRHGQVANSVVSTIGLTAASFLLPPLAESSAVMWAQVAAVGVRALDLIYFGQAALDIPEKCKTQLDQFHTIIDAEAKSPNAFCPKSVDLPKANALKNVYECEKGIAMGALAAIPILTALAKDVAILSRDNRLGITNISKDKLHFLGEGYYNKVYSFDHDGQILAVRIPKHYDHLFTEKDAPELSGLIRAEKYKGAKIFGKTKVGDHDALLMEYIPGKRLEDVDRVSPGQCLAIKTIIDSAIADGISLIDAHAANIMITDRGDIRLVDITAVSTHKEIRDLIAEYKSFEGKDPTQKDIEHFKSITDKENRLIYKEFIKKGGDGCSFLNHDLNLE